MSIETLKRVLPPPPLPNKVVNRKACATSFEYDTESSFFEFTGMPLGQVRPLLLFIRTFQRKGHPHHPLSRSSSGTFWREAGFAASERRQLFPPVRSPFEPS
jgi:hypothetical protein